VKSSELVELLILRIEARKHGKRGSATRNGISSQLRARMGARLRTHFEEMAKSTSIIGEVRGAGLMLGIEIVADKETRQSFAPELKAGLTFDRIAYENGLVARCMGDVLGFAPPLTVTENDVDEIADRCRTSLAGLETYLRR
jgi:4-aminobutyrate---pyruvate transaminase